MRDPSVLSMAYRYNDTILFQPNLFQDTIAMSTATPNADGAELTTPMLHLLESLPTLVFATPSSTSTSCSSTPFYTENSSENGSTTSSITWDSCDVENPLFNCSVHEFLQYYQGPQMMPFLKAIMLTTVYVIIFLTGVIGNVIVCVVIVRHSTMHTATNYYLFSLAISDLMFLLMGVPFEVSLYWHQYPYMFGLAFCKIRALISEASTYVSVLTIVAFTMERFLAICHPLHLYTMSGFKRAIRIIATLWCISFISALPFAVHTKINYARYPPGNEDIPESAFCAMLENGQSGFPLWEVSTCAFFIIPMTVILVLYVRIGMRIRARTKHTQALGVTHGSIHSESKKTQSRKAIIRMLAAVVLTFFVCWAPFHAQRLLYLYGQRWEHYKTFNEWLFVSGGYLYYISCTINPILYNVMSHRYRIAFRETLCGRRRRSQFSTTGYSINQSSFHETTIAETGCSSEHSRLMRIRSVIPSMRYSRYKDQKRLGSNSVKWKDIHRNDSERKSSVVVIMENNLNGRSKCFKTSSFPLTNGSTTSSTTISNEAELCQFQDTVFLTAAAAVDPHNN